MKNDYLPVVQPTLFIEIFLTPLQATFNMVHSTRCSHDLRKVTRSQKTSEERKLGREKIVGPHVKVLIQ